MTAFESYQWGQNTDAERSSANHQEQFFPYDTEHFERVIRPNLEIFNKGGLTIYHGSQLTREGSMADYIRPAEFVDRGGERHIYHYVYVGCTPHDLESGVIRNVDINMISAGDTSVKTGDLLTRDYGSLNHALMGQNGRPTILVRKAHYGNVAFPNVVVTPEPNLDADYEHLGQFARYMHESGQHIKITSGLLKDKLRQMHETEKVTGLAQREAMKTIDGMTFFNPREVEVPKTGRFIVYDVEIANDPWKIYQIYTKTPLHELENLSGQELVVRIDSGCECGHIYEDTACDCRHQFHLALKRIAEEKLEGRAGMVLHIPGHDGRGYGMAPKAETEITKEGRYGKIVGPEHFRDSRTKQFLRKGPNGIYMIDTVGAAKMLYGTRFARAMQYPDGVYENVPFLGSDLSAVYDIRTFDGCSKILGHFNPDTVVLLTHNVAKAETLRGNFKVRVEPVYRDLSEVPEATRIHVRQKLESELYQKGSNELDI